MLSKLFKNFVKTSTFKNKAFLTLVSDDPRKEFKTEDLEEFYIITRDYPGSL